MQEAFAKGTLKNLRVQVGKYQEFCDEYGRIERPASINTLTMYIQYLGKSLVSIGGIKNYTNGVKIWHLLGGYQTKAFETYSLQLMYRGMERKLQHQTHQALPITPRILKEIRGNLDMENVNDITKWALYLIAFFLVCRKSNLVPDSANSYNKEKQLSRGHFQKVGQDLRVTMTWTKTIQFNERKLVVPIPRIRESNLCPVRAYTNMIKMVPGNSEDPAFVKVNKKGHKGPWTYRMFNKELKEDVARTGRDPKKYSTHSFRRGAATFAFEAGVEAETVKIMGDWRSDCFRQYLQVSMHKKEEAAQKIKDKIIQLAL